MRKKLNTPFRSAWIAKSRPKGAETDRIQLVQPPDLAIRREQVG